MSEGLENNLIIWIIQENSLVLLQPLCNIEITKYFSYKPKFNGVFSVDNFHKRKDGVNFINLDDIKRKAVVKKY